MARSKSARSGRKAGGRATAVTGKRSARQEKNKVKSADSPVAPLLSGNVPSSLARSPVYCKVPAKERARLDLAILFPAEQSDSLEKIAKRLKLNDKYGITPAMLETYARKLDRWMRPTVTSHVMAGVLSCLPKSYRRKLVDGSEVILVSRVLRVLDDESHGLTTAELAKLGSILTSLGRRANRRGGGNGTTRNSVAPTDPSHVPDLVRGIYGLPAFDKPDASAKSDKSTLSG